MCVFKLSIMSFGYSKVKEWFRKYVIFSKAVLFISGLVFVHGLVEYGLLATLITHLTNDWEIILPTAAQIVNGHEGFSSVLIIIVAQLSESFFGRFRVILFVTAAFVSGLGILWHEARHPSGSMLFGAVALLTLGKAGRDVPLKAFLVDQLRRPNLVEEENEQLLETRREVWWRFSLILAAGAVVLLSNQEWNDLSKISFIAMVVGLFWFMLGFPFYVYKEPIPSPLCNVINVVKAALSKRHLDYPVSPDQLLENIDTDETQILPEIAFLRWVDKAVISEPSQPSPGLMKQQMTAGVVEIATVREVKTLLKMLPMWLTFIVYGLVEATGSTFFFEQAQEMDDRVGNILSHLPIETFVIFRTFTSSSISIIYPLLYKNANERRPLLNRICFGMLCSVFCCLTAWRVEAFRLGHVEILNNDVDFNIEYISVFWLIPQFFLLGLMDGFATSGVGHFFESEVSESMSRYGTEFTELALGFGKFFSVICILIFRSWFNENINTSRLDMYYAVLLVLASLNFCICCLVSYWYGNQPHDTEMSHNAQELEQVVTNENSGVRSFTVTEQANT